MQTLAQTLKKILFLILLILHWNRNSCFL